jgi:hypothetical protein
MAVQNKLASIASGYQNRSAPATMVSSFRSPDFLACLFIQGRDVGVDVSIAILDDDIVYKNRARSDTPWTFEVTEMFRPQRFAV